MQNLLEHSKNRCAKLFSGLRRPQTGVDGYDHAACLCLKCILNNGDIIWSKVHAADPRDVARCHACEPTTIVNGVVRKVERFAIRARGIAAIRAMGGSIWKKRGALVASCGTFASEA